MSFSSSLICDLGHVTLGFPSFLYRFLGHPTLTTGCQRGILLSAVPLGGLCTAPTIEQSL
jgi:hypothetical protein